MLAVPYPTSFYEPNQGIYPGMTPPPSLDNRFPDVDSPLPVYIIVSPHPSPSAPNPRTRPWSIAWPLAMSSSLLPALLPAPDAPFAPVALPVPSESVQHAKLHRVVAVARVLEAARERSRDNFTFWGPLTRPWSKPDMLGTRWVLIGVFDRPTRRALERLADRVRLMKPNGWWNGQNWVVALLNAAVDEGVLSFTQRDAALLTAAFI